MTSEQKSTRSVSGFLDAFLSELRQSPERLAQRFREFRIQEALEELNTYVHQVLEPQMQGADARQRTIMFFAFLNGLVAGLPLPFPDMPVLTALEIVMVQRLAGHHGIDLSPGQAASRILALGGTVAAGFVLQTLGILMHQAIKVIGLGSGAPLSFFLVFTLTWMFGVLADGGLAGTNGKPPMRAVLQSMREGASQARQIGANVLTPAVWAEMGRRLKEAFTGNRSGADSALRRPTVVSDATYVTAGMVALSSGDDAWFETEAGQHFWDAAVRAIPEWENTPKAEIAAELQQASPGELQGYHSLIKGEVFEQAVVRTENADGNDITAEQFADRTHPDTDLIVQNEATGEVFEASLKASDNAGYVAEALQRYDESVIWTTSEVADNAALQASGRVFDTGISNAEIDHLTAEGLEEVRYCEEVEAHEAAAAGLSLAAAVAVAPTLYQHWQGALDAETAGQRSAEALRRRGIKLAGYGAAAVTGLGPLALVYATVQSGRGVLNLLEPVWAGVEERS